MLSGGAGKIVIQSIIFFERQPSLNDAILKENKKFSGAAISSFGFKKDKKITFCQLKSNQNLPKIWKIDWKPSSRDPTILIIFYELHISYPW